MTVCPVEDHFAIIEQLLDGALSRVGDATASPPAIISSSFQEELGQSLQNLQRDMEKGVVSVTKKDRDRLNEILKRILKIEGMTHARLSWFAELEANLREEK